MSKKILLADDSVTIRKIVELTFSDSDYRVESTRSGVEALARFESMRPDVVVTDVSMPGREGYEFCRSIKRSAHPVPVLLLASTFKPLDEEDAAWCAADAHLTKPFDSGSLVRKVELLLTSPPLRIEFDPGEEPGETAPVPEVVPPEIDIALAETPEASADEVVERESSSDRAVEAGVLGPSEVSALAREVVRLMSDEIVRDIAREIVPQVAERVVRERIRELEADES